MAMVPGKVCGNVVYDPMAPFYHDVWDQMRDVHHSQSQSRRITPYQAFTGDSSPFVAAHIDWKDTAEAHVLKAELPGLKKEDVKVEAEDGRFLTIMGEKKIEKEEKVDKWHRVERCSGVFVRKFRLPDNANMEKVTACMENGLLTVTVPKVEIPRKNHVRPINII